LKPTLVVKLDAIRRNVSTWRTRLDDRPLWAIVKCDAYRMGMIPVARAALAAGAQRLCVVEIWEAALLRAAGISAPIVHVAATPEEDVEAALRLGVAVSVADINRATLVSRTAKSLGIRATVHVAIETGTGWWGIAHNEAATFAESARGLDAIEWEAAWTHIAGRDSMAAQMKRFRASVEQLRRSGIAVPIVHAASSGPTVWGLREGAARIGVGLYGAALGDERLQDKLQTALEVRAPVYGIRRFSEPTPLGYGGTYVALPGQTIVTLRLGYGEGIPKAMAARGSVLLADVLCPIVGAIGMNFTMIAVPPNIDLPKNGEAVVIGDVPGVRLEEVAAAAQTIPHNVLTLFGAALTPAYTDAHLERSNALDRQDVATDL
jgi:alanine racemase